MHENLEACVHFSTMTTSVPCANRLSGLIRSLFMSIYELLNSIEGLIDLKSFENSI